MNWLQRVLSASYLYAQEITSLGYYQSANLGWGSTLLAILLVAWIWRRWRGNGQRPTWLLTSAIWASAFGLFMLMVRPLATGALSARVWFFAPTVFGLALLILQGLASLPETPARRVLFAALALRTTRKDSPLSREAWFVLSLIHGAALCLALGQTSLFAGWRCLVLLGSLFLLCWRLSQSIHIRRVLRFELLSPLLLSYIGWGLYTLLTSGLGADMSPYRAFPYAEPWSLWFDPPLVWGVGVFWTILSVVSHLARSVTSGALPRQWFGRVALLTIALWYVGVCATQLSHGATGSDPFCYLQMAEDIALRGTPLHAFPLAGVGHAAGVPVWPTVHVGYHPPQIGHLAATVWPVGWPFLLAPFYALGGERLALLIAPVCAILASWGMLRYGQMIYAGHNCRPGWFVGYVAAAILLTSREGVLRTLVPMADAAAQLSTVLFVLGTWRVLRRDRLRDTALTALILALGYTVRHPQLLMGPALPLAIALSPWPRWRKCQHLFTLAAALALGMMPDLLYHTLVFGAPWLTESPEWHLIAWRHIPDTWISLWHDGWLRRPEFGYLWAFIGYGLGQQLRRAKTRALGLISLAGFSPLLLFSLCYSALRWRDLIPLFPWLALWAAWGFQALWRKVGSQGKPPARRAAFIGLALLLLGARARETVDLLWSPDPWTFGYVSASERRAFSELASALPDDVLIACSLDSGAVERYTGHLSFRPSSWPKPELDRFLGELGRRGDMVVWLDDGEEMAQWLARGLAPAIEPAASYDLPTFGLGGQRLHRPALLYLQIVDDP